VAGVPAQDLLRRLPPIGGVLAGLTHADLAYAPLPEWTEESRLALSELRARVLSGELGPVGLERASAAGSVLAAARKRIARRRDPGLVRVVNATGVVLHTNLGRAPLPPSALEAVARDGRGCCLLAADRETGERAPRERHVDALLRRLTGCEAATTVNNNAAATLVVLAATAAGKEVVVSRGQLVEIGGAYRIPEVMAQSGAVLREVGTTNRTHLADYERAIGPKTGLLLRVHTSNYRVVGFQGEVPLEDLVALGRAHGVPVADDLGSGALVSLAGRGGLSQDEPLVSKSVAAGADLVTASGDKLIGGPQMGLVLGKADAVARVRAHPLYRALRCGKLDLIAMEATLRLFLDPATLEKTHPTYAALLATRETTAARAQALLPRARAAAPAATIDVVDAADAVGAGSLPTEVLPGTALRVTVPGVEAGALARRLRAAATPVFSVVHDDAVHLHVRTLGTGEEDLLLAALREAAGEPSAAG
jgi:L-seryl-tRNA(Ser) seleniumtransferase